MEIGGEGMLKSLGHLKTSLILGAVLTFNSTVDLPKGSMGDIHNYNTSTNFLNEFNYWDNWQMSSNNSDVGALVCEYLNW